MNWVQKHAAICRDEWFKDHYAAELSPGIFEFRKPGTWTYGMRFIIHSRWLAVLGDIGEATYEWSETITPDFLRNLDFDYFRSKCRASESGRDFDLFDAEAGAEALAVETARMREEEYPHPRHTALDELSRIVRRCSCRDEWRQAVWRRYEEGVIDADTASDAFKLAIFPHPRQIGHWVGVQMALNLLAEEKEIRKP